MAALAAGCADSGESASRWTTAAESPDAAAESSDAADESGATGGEGAESESGDAADDRPLDVPASHPGSPVPMSHQCGNVTSASGFEVPVFVGAGTVRCAEAEEVGQRYFDLYRDTTVRGQSFDGWSCGVNSGSAATPTESNFVCRRGDDAVVIGTPNDEPPPGAGSDGGAASDVPAAFTGHPVPMSLACGSVSGPVGVVEVFVGTGAVECTEALGVADQYFAQSSATGARAVGFDGWSCGVNTGSGRSSAESNMACVRGDDSVAIGRA